MLNLFCPTNLLMSENVKMNLLRCMPSVMIAELIAKRDENIVLKEKGTYSSHDDHGEKEDNPPTTPIQDLSSLLDKRSVANPPQVFSGLVSWVIISLCSLYFHCYT